MTITNVVLNATGATVAVDSAVAVIGGYETRIRTAVKMLPLPSARSIVLGRGSAAFLSAVFMGCYLGAEDFDSLITGLARTRDKISADVQAQVERDFGPEWASAGKNQIVVVGWLVAARRASEGLVLSTG